MRRDTGTLFLRSCSTCIWFRFCAGMLGADLSGARMCTHSASHGMAAVALPPLVQMRETNPPGQAVCLSTSEPASAI